MSILRFSDFLQNKTIILILRGGHENFIVKTVVAILRIKCEIKFFQYNCIFFNIVRKYILIVN